MNDAQRFELAGEIFAEAVDTDPADRPALLARRCADPALRSDVDALLAEHARRSPLDGGLPERVVDVLAGEEASPATIGPYRIVRRIGHGGMGIVWEATQTAPDRTVAVKVIRREIDSPSVIARFEAERQMLALMDHPNVATVLGGGTTASGRPFLAMEYVAGTTLIQYASEARLDVPTRLRLFIDVCGAIQHAHQKGIIHRDIKPSNVLVAERDGVPVPKVIDFGIAKLAAPDSRHETLTRQGQLIGTPAYMSPEQAGLGSSHDIDTQSDIYALGVLLYELLTGDTPLEVRDDQSMAEVLRTIRDVDPSPPSARLQRTDAATAARVRGDLDWIVMQCLEKERSRRYPSAAALADDIQRHLADQTVTAGPPSLGYSMRKFVRRNRPQVIAASVAALALTAGAIGTAAGLVRALDAEQQATLAAADARAAANAEAEARAAAQASAEQAERETAVAEETIAFLLTDVLGAADPARAESRDLTVRDAVRTAGEQLEDRFADRPDVELRIRNTVARTLEQIGDPIDAEPHRLRELELLRSLDAADSLRPGWAQLSIATNLMQQGRLLEGVEVSEDLVERLRPMLDPDEDLMLAALGNLGVGYLQTGQMALAAPILEETLASKRRTLGDDHPSTLTSIHNLAGLQSQLGNATRALELVREALDGRTAVLGPGDPRSFSSLNLLVHILQQVGQFETAIAELEVGMQEADVRLGERHPTTILLSRSLAALYHRGGDLPAAEALTRRTLQVMVEDTGPDSLQTLLTQKSLAVIVGTQGGLEESRELLLKAMTTARQIWPPDSIDLADTLAHLANAETDLERFADAERRLDEAIGIIERNTVRDNRTVWRIARSTTNLYEDWAAAEPEAGHTETLTRMLSRMGIDAVSSDPEEAIKLWERGERPAGPTPQPRRGG